MEELIRKILREQTESISLCIPVTTWQSGTPLSGNEKFGACRRTCLERDADNQCIRYDNCGRDHNGVDLDAPSGTDLYAPADGKIEEKKVDDGGGCGGLLKIKHAHNTVTKYCHLLQIDVEEGEDVKRGQIIGKTGGDAGDVGAGNSTHAHLHYEVWVNGTAVDPIAAGYLTTKCSEVEEEKEVFDDDPLAFLIWINRGDVGTEEESRTAEEILELLPDCYKKLDKDRQEDALALDKLWQWNYIDVPEEKFEPFDLTNPVNIKALLDYQNKYGLKVLPVDIVNGCRIPQETLDHISVNDVEVIVNE